MIRAPYHNLVCIARNECIGLWISDEKIVNILYGILLELELIESCAIG